MQGIKKISRKILNMITILLTLFFTLGCVGTNPVKNDSDKQIAPPLLTDYFPLNMETQWLYSVARGTDITEEICTLVEITSGDDDITYWSRIQGDRWVNGFISAQGISLRTENDISFQPPLHLLHQHIQAGDEIVTNANLETEDAALPIIVTSVLNGLEDVTTPGGVYKDCIHYIVYLNKTTETGAKGFAWREEWLAKGIGVVKNLVYDYEGNLQSESVLKKIEVK